MGANGTKESSSKCNVNAFGGLTANEERHIQQLFQSIAEPKVENVSKLWNGKVDKHFKALIMIYLSKSESKTSFTAHDFKMLFAHFVHGTVDDKSDILLDMLTKFQRTHPIPCSVLQQYLDSLIKSYILLHAESGWRESSQAEIQCLSQTLCGDLPEDNIGYEKLCSWIACTPNMCAIQMSVFGRLYGLKTVKQRLLPICDRKNIQSVLDVSSVLYLNACLPAALRDEWRILFSTANHGESFSKLIGCIVNKGPTILIIRDKEGHVFGGFAPHSWILGPNFLGDDTSFLFRLKPAMDVYASTHYNNHYQYLNTQQQTMPNGLGMGGQFGYWGLWLDAEYGTGQSSETCTTYRDCKMLSSSKNFLVDHLEVWAVGPLPVVEEDVIERSILDTNTEAKAILEMAGKHAHSDGLREPEPEDY